jgi:uncharacterized phiE125 gp8 family phage protein
MALLLVTDASAEPVVAMDIKHHLRLSTVDTGEDALLGNYITVARKMSENKTHAICLPQTWKMTLDTFPGATDVITFPFYPLSSTVGEVVITYMDESSGDSTTLAATAYTVDYESEPPRVYPSPDNEWPETYDARKAVQIQFKVGYPLVGVGTSASTPDPIRQWIKMKVGALYENRESMTITNLSYVNQPHSNFDGLLDNYVMPEVY